MWWWRLSALFGIGYAEGAAASRTGWTGFAVFAVGLQLVPAAADAVTFLLAWELMAGGSTVLLLADHAVREPVRRAAIWYAVMTHLSFLLLLVGFGVLTAAAGGTSWDTMAAAGIEGPVAGAAFVLLTAGFATKAGLVPVHVWLPRAHPEAPSHMSAAMSAAMVKMGVYGIMLVVLRLLPGGPQLVGGAADRPRCRFGALRDPAGVRASRRQASARLLDDGERRADRGRRRRGRVAARLRPGPGGRRGSAGGPAADGEPRRVQDRAVPGRRLRPARHRRARPGPAGWPGDADALDGGDLRHRRDGRCRACP